jgi:hypothetical protein
MYLFQAALIIGFVLVKAPAVPDAYLGFENDS